MDVQPVVIEISPFPSVPEALSRLAGCRNVVLFESSLIRPPLGRYSFLAANPFEVLRIPVGEISPKPFARISALLQKYPAKTISGLPPFQGGAAGLLSYELGRCFEVLPVPQRDEFQIPLAVIGFYRWVLAWDHVLNRCWFIGHGFPAESPSSRRSVAEQDWQEIRTLLQRDEISLDEQASAWSAGTPSIHRSSGMDRKLHTTADKPVSLFPGLRSNFTRQEYLEAVQNVIDKIVAGDIFQTNLSQRFTSPASRPPVAQYLRLREQNPAPFAGFFAEDDWAVLSSSPERFLQLQNRTVSTRPIKGTRQRGSIPEADLYTRDELRESEKDRAENVMIVDLLRNDLSRVCRPGTIRVSELCTVEAYQTVSHLVSEIHGTLRPGATFWDLLEAAFPGGSITGAPKIRAMEIITELEQVARGPYCGSLFYHGFDGIADSNLLIRTMLQKQNWLTFSAGGGIVSQSTPVLEYEETLHKVAGLLNALK